MLLRIKDWIILTIWCTLAGATTANRTETAASPSPRAYTYSPMHIIADKIPPECMNFTFGRMEFYSPNYPDKYPSSIECIHIIEADPGYEIHLDFRERFDIEPPNNEECKFDYIEVRNGPYGYSQTFGRYCGDEYPPLLISSGRFMWLRFVSDDDAQYRGFKGIYKFRTKEDYKPEKDNQFICRHILKDKSGTLSSGSINPLITNEIDCTWEIQGPPKSKVYLSGIEITWRGTTSCDSNRITIYETTTTEKGKKKEACGDSMSDLVIDSNLVYIRVYAPFESFKPDMKMTYTILTPPGGPSTDLKSSAHGSSDFTCRSGDFFCDGACVSQSMRCDGNRNCPSGIDEEDCVTDTKTGLPLYIIIAGAIGGVIVTAIAIGLCLKCRFSKRRRMKEIELAHQQEKFRETAVEMSSPNTTLSGKRNPQQSGYFSLPRPQGVKSGNYKDNPHRNSLTSSLQAPSEGEYGDQSSDPGNYKKFMTLDQYTEDESSPCPSLYNQGPVLTTIIERHDMPPPQTEIDGTFGWNGYGWKQPQYDPRSPSSLSENLAKLARYNVPHKNYQFNPETKMYTPDPKYDITAEQRLLLGKEFKMKYGSPIDKEISLKDDPSKQTQAHIMKSHHPDITRDLEVT